ncbi:MAG: cytochrome c oxidase subunit 3 [Burkholderiaceae bacterium]|nr:MAG: cytochrome c oxidase subunit 3 [Burkholderiaceae bacterium]
MSNATSQRTAPYYFVPSPSPYPILAMIGVFLLITGFYTWINSRLFGRWVFLVGLVWWLFIIFHWFKDTVVESESGKYGRKIDVSYRWGMSWFIYSEVMFFGAFFTALWYAHAHALPELGDIQNALLWPNFKAVWPSFAAGATASPAGTIEPFQTMGPFWLPTINTILLLSSAVTLTIAHHALQIGKRGRTIAFMWITLALGITFLCCQAFEYHHAYTEMNLKLSSGIYGSTFFMLTGFHGFHVLVGTIMLFFITLRLMKGHFTQKRHFGFEGAAWYWHFVDVVWLGLYVTVYWL